ncbi:glycogen synthase [Planococcus antarcticus DSM 14505]|uniref:Glycogen synthase n=1 Tax=Planococcus antarcticus DSM 14505 TaxID=1185653 RepID=A0A1C7DCQ9_9BACL|nr:glycogen synthase GlgA [Planococcus antarcticus]ANU09053.1 starch synthase [Planococcus antarcticus DSM 14505]EIM07308.1 glycogen synthase [Planococcus antarcticus DSM 14505]
MKIIMAAAECAPFAKAGGLADVMGALPKELSRLGHELNVIVPKYSLISEEYISEFALKESLEFDFKGQQMSFRVLEYNHAGVKFLFVENDDYFKRDQIYGQVDDSERYAFFNRAVLEIVRRQEKPADLLHVHDWHTAMVPFLLKEDQRYTSISSIKTVLTIHNLQFQGKFSRGVFLENFEMDARYYDDGSVEWNGNFNSLKTGISYVDKVTTVSPTYRDEILTDFYGEKLNSLLQEKEQDLIGILNGIDTEVYNPATDLAIEREFDAMSIEGKQVNKRAIQSRVGLPERGDVPLLTMISRLSGQKGIDVLQEVLPTLLAEQEIQFVLLGSGEEQYEQFFKKLAIDFPNKVYVHVGFDEAFAHLLYAGADIFLMPSHFEPCGLSQLISMRYGTVPVANKTGGLKDTVIEYDEHLKAGNGFLSDFLQNKAFSLALERCLAFYQQPEHWEVIKKNGMKGDYSWSRSAIEYAKLYDRII